MCVATGPVQYIWRVSEYRDGKLHFIWGEFSREDWANQSAEHWRKNYPESTFEVMKIQVDWWMRCH